MMNIKHIVSAIRQRVILVLGSLMVLALLAAPTQVFAQCAGDVGFTNDGVDNGGTPGIPDYLIENLPETVTWTVTPAAGGALNIDVSEVLFGLTCANNGNEVPCENGNDGQDGNNAETPFIYTQGGGGDPTGTCGATLASNAAGVVTFQMPPGALDQTGCTIIFETQLVDKGIDASPNEITSAAAFEGTCLGGALAGSASGSAVVEILEQAIAIEKRVRDPATGVFVDADTAPGPTYLVGATVEYQLEVCNTGNEDLTDVTIDDANLGIVGANIGSLPVGQCVTLEEGTLPTGIPGLDSTTACASPGPFTNTAVSTGTPESGPPDVTDSDPANVECVSPPEIAILKEVSVDGGATWYDANIPPDFPPEVGYPAGAMYRVTVSNPGAVDLVNVTVDDPVLGIAGYPVGDLAAGASVLLDGGDVPGLDVAERCDAPGTFTNIAFANGDSALTGTAAPEAQDPASMVCIESSARFRVIKTFSDGSNDEVDVLLTCNTGLPLQQPFTITGGDPAGVTFVVTEFVPGTMRCEVTETRGPEGYTPIFNDGDGCVWENIVAGLYTCEISNTADFATFSVYKDWVVVNEGGQEVIEAASVTIWCSSEIFGGYYNDNVGKWYKTGILGDNDILTATVDTTQGPTTCYATESINLSGVESEGNCDPRPIPAGGSSTCTFVNTVFFEGIPTLSQYGLAILALLMLGMGLVGFRRFA